LEVARREDQNRAGAAPIAQFLEDRVAIPVRQAQIEDDQVRLHARDERHRLRGTPRDLDFVAVETKVSLEGVRQIRTVLHDEDPAHWESWLRDGKREEPPGVYSTWVLISRRSWV